MTDSIRPAQMTERFFQLALHCAGVRLSLASGKTGAVVGKDHLVTCHCISSATVTVAVTKLLFNQLKKYHLSRIAVAWAKFRTHGCNHRGVSQSAGQFHQTNA